MQALKPLRVAVDSSPVYELLLQLNAFTGRPDLSTFDVGQRWGATQRARCSATVLRALQRLGGAFASWDGLIGLQATVRATAVPAFVEALERTDAEEIFLHMLGGYATALDPAVRTAMRAAVEGNRRARATVMASFTGDEPEQRDAVFRLLQMPVSAVKHLVLESITGWYERNFIKEEPSLSQLLADDAAARRALLNTDPERLILIATGVRYESRPDIDKAILVPTLIMRPWLAVVNYQRLRIFCYPVLDDPRTPETVPSSLLRIHQTLADPASLRILKALGSERLSAAALADRLAEDPQRVRAHLARLRMGRLVQLYCGEQLTFERRTDLLRAVGQPLKSYLQIPAS